MIDRYGLTGRELSRSLRDKGIRDLVDVGVVLLQVNAVRSGVGNVHKEAVGQLTLDVQIELLNIARFRVVVWRQVRGAIGSHEL